MARLIRRDPFSRTELWRETVQVSRTTCSFCGQVKQFKKYPADDPGPEYLYHYYIETDSGACADDSKLFCGLSCRNAFYGL